MPPKLFQRATADGYAAEAETAKERLDRLEREYKIKQEKAKRRAKNSGPNLRWKPPVVERLTRRRTPSEAAVEAPVENEDDDHELMYVLNKRPEINFTYCGQTPFSPCNHGKVGVEAAALAPPDGAGREQRSDGQTPSRRAARHLSSSRFARDGAQGEPAPRGFGSKSKANDGRSALWCAAHRATCARSSGSSRTAAPAAPTGRRRPTARGLRPAAQGDLFTSRQGHGARRRRAQDRQGGSKQRRQRPAIAAARRRRRLRAHARRRRRLLRHGIYDVNLDDLNREKRHLATRRATTTAADGGHHDFNAGRRGQGGGDNLAMFGGGKKKSPFGRRVPKALCVCLASRLAADSEVGAPG